MSLYHSGIGMTSQRTRARMIDRLRVQDIEDEVILAAMNSVPRHLFVEEALASRAYDDVALPINFGQTISSPFGMINGKCQIQNPFQFPKKSIVFNTKLTVYVAQ